MDSRKKIERVFTKEELTELLRGKHILLAYMKHKYKSYRVLCYLRKDK